MLKATILSAVLVFLPIAAHAEGSPRDIDLALGAVSANGDYKKFVSDYEGVKCYSETPTAEKISYSPGNHGDSEVILVVQKMTCPKEYGRTNKPAIVFYVELWRANTSTVTPESRFTDVQEVKFLKLAN